MRATRLALVAILVIGCVGLPAQTPPLTPSPTNQSSPAATGHAPTLTPTSSAAATSILATPSTPALTPPATSIITTPSTPTVGSATPTPAVASPAASPLAGTQRIAEGLYLEEPQLVLDANGAAHVVAAYDSDGTGGEVAVFYYTNRDGSWTRERLARKANYGSYSITTDADGSVWMAFKGDDGIYVQSIGSAATQFIDNPRADNPSLVVRDGRIHVAYLAYPAPSGGSSSPPGTVRYATDATGALTDEEVGRGGDDVALEVEADGTPLVLVHDPEVGVPFQFGVGATTTGSFSFQTGPHSGDTDVDYQPLLASDGSGLITATWVGRESTDFIPPSTVFYSRFDGAWSEPENVGDLGGVPFYGRAIEDSGAIHVVADGGGVHDSVYTTNAGGEFEVQPLPAGNGVTSNPAVAVDALGEPHFVYMRYKVEPDDDGDPVASGYELLYRVGIGD